METTKGRLIQFFQGNRVDLPILKIGEPAFCVDEYTFWLGSSDGNKQVAMISDIGSASIQDGAITYDKLSQDLKDTFDELITLNDIPVATTSVNGLMSSDMVTKLNGIDENANKTVIVDNLTTVNSLHALSARQGKLLKEEITDYGVRINAIENSNKNYVATVTDVWNGVSAPFTQTIPVLGILSTDNPIIFPIYSTTNEVAIEEQKTWLSISNITTGIDSITLTCFEEKPTFGLSIQLKVVR